MNTLDARLVISAVRREQYPPEELPEFAFAGRSNVGKSSLINMLLGRKKLAHTSSSPGKTRTMNFYEIGNAFRLVDLPGYGYAKVSKSEQEKWGPMMETYLRERTSLLGVCLLVDGRHSPTVQDQQMLAFLEHLQCPTLVIMNKIDKLKKGQRVTHRKTIAKKLSMSSFPMMLSAQTREGKFMFWEWVNQRLCEEGYDLVVEASPL